MKTFTLVLWKIHSFIILAPLRDDIILKSMSFVGKVKMRETIRENLDSKTFIEFPRLLYVSRRIQPPLSSTLIALRHSDVSR